MGRHAVRAASRSGGLGDLAGVPKRLELRSAPQAQSDVEPDDAEDARNEERDAPAVGVHRLFGQERFERGDRHRPQQETDHHRPDEEGDHQSAVPRRRVFGQEAGTTVVLAARREALNAAQKHQQHGRRGSNRAVARHQADAERGQGHQDDHDRKHSLAADPVTEWTEEESAEWTHEERDREDRERAQQACGAVGRREELLGDVGGEESVDGEVVSLDGVADAGHDDRLAERARLDFRCL